jgi:hypothetical protein
MAEEKKTKTERDLNFNSQEAYAASLKKGGDVKNETTAGPFNAAKDYNSNPKK